jgi:hypothetical protein
VSVAVIAGLLWYQRGTLDEATDSAGLLFFEMVCSSSGQSTVIEAAHEKRTKTPDNFFAGIATS